MIRLFKHYVPHAVLLLGMLDLVLLLSAAEVGWILRARQIGMDVDPLMTRVGPLLSFAVAIQTAMIAVGVYGPEALQSIRFALARLLVAISLGVIFLSVMHFVLPDLTLWRSNSLYAMGLAVALLLAVRLLLGSMLGGEAFKRRLVVLGAGNRANRIRELE
ncbi:MAG TPA: sugar transferase, partial [Sphingobium sp.]